MGYAVAGPVGSLVGGAAALGGRDRWMIEITENDGKRSTIAARSQSDAEKMAKRIRRHIK